MNHLDISEHVLRGYLGHGESLLLAILIHFTHQLVRNILSASWDWFPTSFAYGWLESNFDVQNTLPGLQHDFCGLWNEIVRQLERRDGNHPLFLNILEKIHPIYVALHQGSTPDGQYQLCSTPSHLIDSASNLNEIDDGRAAEAARAPITTSPALRHHDAVPSVIPPVTDHDAPPPPSSNPDHAIPHLVNEQSHNGLLDNIIPLASSIHLAPLENGRIRVPDGTVADSIQVTTDPSVISSMVNTGSRSTPSHDTASRPTGNTITAAPSFVPDTVPPPIPLLSVSTDPAAPYISADPIVNESGGPLDDGSMSLSPSQISTTSPLASLVISCFDSNATTQIGPLDAPDDALDPNRRTVSLPLTQPLPDMIADSPRLENHGQSKNLA